MKREREMKEDKDGKAGGEQGRERQRVCTGAEYSGYNYSATCDEMTQGETDVQRCCILMPRYNLRSASRNNSQLQLEAVSHLRRLIKRDAHQRSFNATES